MAGNRNGDNGDRGDSPISNAVFKSDDVDAKLYNAAYQPGGRASCDDYTRMVQGMDQNKLLDRVNDFIGGTLKQNGLDTQQLDNMLKSNKFTSQDKEALQYIRDNFDRDKMRNGNPQRLSVQEFAAGMFYGAMNQCKAEGRGTPGQDNNNGRNNPPRVKR